MTYRDFSLVALQAALDARRIERGLTWAELSGEVARVETGRRVMASSTITGIGTRAVAEGDGVLQMLVWLARTPESFIPEFPNADAARYRLPAVPADRILRFDAKSLYAALDGRRKSRGVMWKEVAVEIPGHAPGMLTRLAQGGRVIFPGVMRICQWLDEPAASFTHLVARPRARA